MPVSTRLPSIPHSLPAKYKASRCFTLPPHPNEWVLALWPCDSHSLPLSLTEVSTPYLCLIQVAYTCPFSPISHNNFESLLAILLPAYWSKTNNRSSIMNIIFHPLLMSLIKRCLKFTISCTALCSVWDELGNIKCSDLDWKKHNHNAMLCHRDCSLNTNCITMTI